MTSLLALMLFTAAPEGGDAEISANEKDGTEEYGPFFEAEPATDTAYPSDGRKTKYPVLSVGSGAFCFVEGSHCKASMLASAEVAAGVRAPSSDKGPDLPHAHYGFRGGFVVRPLMFSRKAWHPWGIGVIGSWTRGTGSATVEGDADSQEVAETERTDAWRVAAVNQLWLSRKRYGVHLDFTMGIVRSQVLTSGAALFGTHAELAFGWGGWGSVFAGGDFLDRDTRFVFGFRSHGIAAGPIIAAALLGLALGGAL